MKNGILTFHDADNYGAVLQAYALQEIIKEISGRCEIINYKQPYIIKNYRVLSIDKSSVKKLIGTTIYNFISLKIKLQKKVKFNRFRKQYINISNNVYRESKEISGYDTYIVGSDQVWNSDITKKDDTFFLSFCKSAEKKISYAASLGKDVLNDEEMKFLGKNINNIDYISVREEGAVRILSELTDKKIEQTLDPTLLANENIWDHLLNDNKFKYKYILIYRLTNNEEVLKIANQISKKMNLKTLYITDSINKGKYKFKHIKGLGPKEFLTLFKNATFIVTDSFHGTAFAIKFQKDFITVPHATRGGRMNSLLNLLELNKRSITNSKEIDDFYNLNTDYTTANKKLEQEQEKSLKYLKSALES